MLANLAGNVLCANRDVAAADVAMRPYVDNDIRDIPRACRWWRSTAYLSYAGARRMCDVYDPADLNPSATRRGSVFSGCVPVIARGAHTTGGSSIVMAASRSM